jgi:hypothetical protein
MPRATLESYYLLYYKHIHDILTARTLWCSTGCVRAKGHAQLETKRAGTWRAEGTRALAAESKALHLQLRKQRYTNMHALNGHGAAAPCRAHMYKYKLI